MINLFISQTQLMVRLLVLLMVVVCSLPLPPAAAALPPEGCSRKCGDVDIPYPFGMTDECCLDDDFFITCNASFTPPKPFLWGSNINVTEIFLNGSLRVLNYVARVCYNSSGIMDEFEPAIGLGNFTIDQTLNKFVVVGCDSYGYLQGEGFTTGCISMCENETDVNGRTSCDGVGCCMTDIPEQMYYAKRTVGSFYNHTNVSGFSPCTYAFLVEQERFKFSFESLENLESVDKLPLVLSWTIGNGTCEQAEEKGTSACKGYSICHNTPENNGYRCSCSEGYEGNPYIENGCTDIDECEDEVRNECTKIKGKKHCENIPGSYTCSCPNGYSGEGRGENGCKENQNMTITFVVIGIASGIIALLLATILLYLELKRRSSKRTKDKLFLQNGGILLTEKLARRERSPDMVRIFSSSELQKATNDFHSNMIVGQGGFGTVYKGFLPDNRIVAIKRSKIVDPNQIEQFINEVFVVSQINHRNVVRLLGCCLETEAPLLVYEFISNGTLSAHIHDEEKARFLSWETRLKIATETAAVLSYLHSATSTPIIHRDVKSDNILLDHTFTAKVADFGASRLVPLDQTQLSTVVQGTFGYLDPEYLQTHQLTEKSDVYSFGVVLSELLTGRKAISPNRPEEERNLVKFFLSIVRQERLFEILDDNIMGQGNMDQILEVARLAKGCLNVKGEDRPSMKEVAMELEGLILTGKHSWAKNEENAEELESLLGEEGLKGFNVGEGSSTSVGYDSITGHILLPMSGGR